jgi:hypothetical protein
VIRAFGITTFIETGTLVGETLAQVSEWFSQDDPAFGRVVAHERDAVFAQMYPKRAVSYPVFEAARARSRRRIVTVDTNCVAQEHLRRIFAPNPHISVVCAHSVEYLTAAVARGEYSQECMFYLDAHANAVSPLREEIRAIIPLRRCIIVIDDFLVPFKPWHLFDMYQGQACGWGFIKDLFADVTHAVYYPRTSNRDYRGTAIIFVGYNARELEWMRTLGCDAHVWDDTLTPFCARILWWCAKALRIPTARLAVWNRLQR